MLFVLLPTHCKMILGNIIEIIDGSIHISLWRVGAVRPLDEAGTHRSGSQISA
jgi:hypothetical protein